METSKKYEDKYFIWKLNGLLKGRSNKSEAAVVFGQKEYVAFVDVYRQYQMEISARVSGVALVESKQILFIGDLIFGSWYESLFGWKDYYFAHQRWGIYLKHFRSLTEVDRLQNFSATSADLKYRLLPGVWEKDATIGLILGYQDVMFNKDSLSMLGFGAFWARSMPDFFDNIFNIVPWFRYPKWVDMEFITYPLSATNTYSLGSNYNLNFHGKMLFTSRFFMEGGLSIRQIQYKRADSTFPPTSGSLLTGTIGFGYNF